MFGVPIDLEPDRLKDFHGEFSAVSVGGATLGELKASSYVVSRTARDIGRRAGNTIWIAQQVRGSAWIDAGKERVHAVPENSYGISHSDIA